MTSEIENQDNCLQMLSIYTNVKNMINNICKLYSAFYILPNNYERKKISKILYALVCVPCE